MTDRFVSVGDDLTLPPSVQVADANLPDRLGAGELTATIGTVAIPRWKPTTAYALGEKVMSPTGETVSAIAAFTSGASYSAANWELSGVYAEAGVRPAWGKKAGTWDARRGLFNAHPGNRRKLDAAIARARGGVGQLHISTFLDSITRDSGDSATKPPYQGSWPGVLATMLKAELGDGGTGLVVPWNDLGQTAGIPALEPRLKFATGAGGSLTRPNAGLYSAGAITITSDGSQLNHMEFTATCDEFWIYGRETGARPIVLIDGVTYKTLAKDINDVGVFDIAAQPGYVHAAVNGGQIVHKIPVTLGAHTIRIMGYPNQILAVEGRIAGKGVRVSNLANSGKAIHNLFQNDNDDNGGGGLSVAFDMTRADLAILMCPMNDFQAHMAIATTMTELGTSIDRQRATGVGVNGGTKAGGDVLLVIPPQPNYAEFPPDHVLNPALPDYYSAIYGLALAKDVPVLDIGYAWKDFATSGTVFHRDNVHPNLAGTADIAQRVRNYIAG